MPASLSKESTALTHPGIIPILKRRGAHSYLPALHNRRELGRAEELRAALDAANAQFRRSDGTYLLQNVFMFAVGRKPQPTV